MFYQEKSISCHAASVPSPVLSSLPVVHHPLYSAPDLPPSHRFPMVCTVVSPYMNPHFYLSLIYSLILTAHNTLQKVFQRIHDYLLESKMVHQSQVHVPTSLPSRQLLHLVHDEDYVDAFCNGTLDDQILRRIGFGDVTKTPVLIQRTKAEVAGTLLTAELALQTRLLAVNTAGGTHHAFRDTGSGFCILNDLAITAESLLHRKLVDKVLIVDLDTHQGDGTAALFPPSQRHDVFTMSVHAANNFPARKQKSHLDIALANNTQDDEYLSVLALALSNVLDSFKPDIVLYDAGVDTHKDDALGLLDLSDEGLQRREYMVFDSCLARNIPVAGVVGGGYHSDLDVLAKRHCYLHRAALDMWDMYYGSA